jgi:multidrug resistance protein
MSTISLLSIYGVNFAFFSLSCVGEASEMATWAVASFATSLDLAWQVDDYLVLEFPSFPLAPYFPPRAQRPSRDQQPEKWKAGNPKLSQKQADISSIEGQDEIHAAMPVVYHYLTFETELPYPPRIASLADDIPPPPGPPDLRRYSSPFNWSETRKTVTVWLSCVTALLVAYAVGAYSSAAGPMSEEWGVSNVAVFVGITTFTTGFAIAPMILAPFSELNGRYPVFVATGILFVVCQLCCGLTRSYPGMLVARFFAGVGGSTFSAGVGGVISDIYHAEGRNTPMALFAGGVLFGTGLGPLCSGFVAQHLGWRWVFYHQVISNGILILAIILFFKETRGSVLLSRKARALNKWYEEREGAGYYSFYIPMNGRAKRLQGQRIRWKVKSDEDRDSLAKMIGISLYRPFRMRSLDWCHCLG